MSVPGSSVVASMDPLAAACRSTLAYPLRALSPEFLGFSRVLRFLSRWGGWPLALGIALVCHAFWQGHGLVDPAFRNPDVAGIAYNARLLDHGLLPYVHSAEIKPPGAFFLFAPLLALGGMRAVWGAAVLWGVALSGATGALAASAWGGKAGPRAVVLHAACAAVASD